MTLNALETILDVVMRQVDRPFLIDSLADRTLTYGQFHAGACSVASTLKQAGVKRRDRVAILLNNSAEFASLYFACLYLGATAVPVNPLLSGREIAFIIEHCGASRLVYEPSLEALVPDDVLQGGLPTLTFQAQGSEQGGGELSLDPRLGADFQPFEGVDPADLFSLSFTSGTTSQPKGVPHRIDRLFAAAGAFNEALGFGPHTRLYHVLTMAYMAGFLNTLLCPFLAGGSVVLGAAFEPTLALRFWEAPVRHQANTLWIVPTMAAALVKIDRDPRGPKHCEQGIERICIGTAPLPQQLRQDFEAKYGVRLLESYGLSEVLFVATDTAANPAPDGSVGPPLPGVQLRFVDDAAQDLPRGQDGEILIRTPFLMAGYLDYETSLPRPPDAEQWFSSGDVGHLSPHGLLFITGRKKDLIIRGGVNISPRVVEEALLASEDVVDAAVVGAPHTFYGEEVVAVIKLEQGRELEQVKPTLTALCKEQLSPLSVPARYVALDAFPVSSTGKVQKNKLRELVAAGTKEPRR